jgi:RAD50-interacting protein 1
MLVDLIYIQPEWYFTHILNVSHEHRFFFDDVIQSLLESTKFRDVDAWVRLL